MADRKVIEMDTILDPKRINPYETTPDPVSTADSDMDYKIMKEASLESFKRNYFKDTKAFKAIVLRVNGDRSAVRRRTSLSATGEDVADYVEVHARIPTLHPMIPKPKMVPPRPEDASKDKGIIEMHPTFLVRRQGELSDIQAGDIVLVEFNKGPGEGIQSEGRVVKLYQKGKVVHGEEGVSHPDDYQRVFVSDTEGVTMADINAADGTLGPIVPPSGQATVKFNWQQLGKVIESQALEPLIDYIGRKEAGVDGYNAVNRGQGGDSPGGAIRYITRDPKNLEEMSIQRARSYMRAGRGSAGAPAGTSASRVNMELTPIASAPPIGGPGFLAIGRFQFTPDTLNESIIRCNAPQSAIFNEESQKRLCAELLLSYRRNLGNYLISRHDSVENAGQDLALIWASLPLQYDQAGGQGRGQSAYRGTAGNRVGEGVSVSGIQSLLRTCRERMKSVLADLGVEAPTTEVPNEQPSEPTTSSPEEEGPVDEVSGTSYTF